MLKLIHFGADRNLIALIYLLLSILIASIAIGINIIAFPSVLLDNDVSSFLIGLSSTNEIIFGIIISIFLSRIVARLTAIGSALIISLIYSSLVLTIFFYQNYYLWLLLAGLTGSCWLSLFVIRQAWINHLIANENRSIILALTTTIFCFGFVISSFTVNYFGAINYYLFITSAALILLSALLMFIVRNTQPQKIDSQKISIKEFLKQEPNTAIARFM
ncbi:MAG TPA: MFS transporter, partial [Rickettsiales bacterium]|nr:MFS transporter [Rickettsiales bacterium]